MIRGINLIREAHKVGHAIRTTRLYERKSIHSGRRISKPRLSGSCNKGKCNECFMLQCNHKCHDNYRIR